MTARENPLYSRDCNWCGIPLAFVKDATGKVQVLDLRAPVFTVVELPGGNKEAVRTTLSYPSHYSTCPKVDEFKRSQGVK